MYYRLFKFGRRSDICMDWLFDFGKSRVLFSMAMVGGCSGTMASELDASEVESVFGL